MITLSEETRRMQDMMKMYSQPGMDMGMFGGDGGTTLILNGEGGEGGTGWCPHTVLDGLPFGNGDITLPGSI